MSEHAPPPGSGVADFLAHFDGDVDAAVRALREYAGQAADPDARPAPPRKIVTRRPPRPRSGKTLIEVNSLAKAYKVGGQQIRALDGVSLTIDQGEFVALTGASGSGKSTLLQLLGGLDKPSSGTVVIDGADLGRMRDGAH